MPKRRRVCVWAVVLTGGWGLSDRIAWTNAGDRSLACFKTRDDAQEWARNHGYRGRIVKLVEAP